MKRICLSAACAVMCAAFALSACELGGAQVPPAYTVVYKANGGSGSMADSTIKLNETKSLSANAFTYPGYNFAGWAVTPGGAVQYADGQSVTNLTKTAGATVTLYAQWNLIPVSGVSLNKNALTLTVGETEKLTATVNPGDTLNKSVTWSSSDSGKAYVDQTGWVQAIAAGTAVITVTTADGGKIAECTVTVINIAAEIVINLGGEWDVIGQTAEAAANTDLVFTVPGTWSWGYRWYLDGVSVGWNSSSYTFNQKAGVYELVVVVTNNAGEKRSGSCRVTVR